MASRPNRVRRVAESFPTSTCADAACGAANATSAANTSTNRLMSMPHESGKQRARLGLRGSHVAAARGSPRGERLAPGREQDLRSLSLAQVANQLVRIRLVGRRLGQDVAGGA